MQVWLRLAKKWNAIVLVENADDYLETEGTQRAVILRALDYFQGTLFLTTTAKHVEKFDRAVMSRIHVHIGFDPLDEPARQKIWKNHLDRLSHNKEMHGLEIQVSDEAKEFVKRSTELQALKWNGHEIRNALQTALALACSQARREGKGVPELTGEHLRQVATMSQNFKNYLDRESAWLDYIYV